MALPKLKRTRILLDEFQYRLLAFNLLYFFIILMVTATLVFLPLMVKLESSQLSPAEQQEVAGVILSLHATFWPAIMVVFALLAVHSVLVSHRIAGALYRFRVVLRAVAAGDLTVRATLRKNDYLVKEASEINAMLDVVGGRVDDAARRCASARDAVTVALNAGDPAELRQALVRADAELAQARAALDRLRTAGQ
jgi:methyl-accepting chemotaxis protein